MSVPPAVQRKFDFVSPYIEQVSKRVRDVVSRYCEERGFAYVGRAKAAESLAEKIETGRFARWRDIDDLFACCVVIPTLGSEEEVLTKLRSAFLEVECRSRSSTKKDPTVFRFDTTRFIGKMREHFSPGSGPRMLDVLFEVQIRTAFEHAWSATTHAMAYKTAQNDWRLLRLAAQLRAVIEQLDQLVQGYEKTAEFITEQEWPEVKANFEITQYFRAQYDDGTLPSEALPSSWSRFSENFHKVCNSCVDYKKHKCVESVKEALATIGEEISRLNHVGFPRSVSLLQFCIGALASKGKLLNDFQGYTPLITQELMDLYPQVKKFERRFDLEEDERG